jgi:energy-coupling factor transporter ATP-binding protein EcfA2
MISFPLLTNISVSHYDLYPGLDGDGMSAAFLPGISLIVGANGLGKSTLITLLYRLMSGPTEIRGQGRDELGSGQLELRQLRPDELRTFAARVPDGAVDATATVSFSLGSHKFSVTRDLRTLSLASLDIDGDAPEASEEAYRQAVLEASGVGSFLDWMLILRYLVFYFEDRRSLVWDPTAQRRLLRMLFLPADVGSGESTLVSRILSQDSYYRNVSATLTRQEQDFRRHEQAATQRPIVELELEEQTAKLQNLSAQYESLQNTFSRLHDDRANARLTALRAEQEQQSSSSNLEHLRLEQIRRAFPSQPEAAAYWLTQLVSEQNCIVCGTHTPDLAHELVERMGHSRCVVCDSTLPADDDSTQGNSLEEAEARLQDASDAMALAIEDRDALELAFREAMASMTILEQEISSVSAIVERLEASLPDTSKSLTARRDALAQLRSDNALIREQVLADKATYSALVNQQNLQISEFQESVKANFDIHARDFLLETCALVWSQVNEQVGQIGQPIKFSVFRVDMTGGAVHAATRRESADQVSESQREFIDLAFRMALIVVAGAEHAGSLVIDAPESSLDAVFAPRAARVLTQFGSNEGGDSRVILTSNLVDGQLIPTIVRLAGIEGPDDPRIVNLFKLAAPTAAITQLRGEYDAALDRAFAVGAGSA